MLDNIYKVNDSVEIFTWDDSSRGSVCIQFYKINTRERFMIESSFQVVKFLSYLDGKKSLKEIAVLYNFDQESIVDFVKFLLSKGLIRIANDNNNKNERFIRQIAYFDDLIAGHTGETSQKILESKKIVIFGLGSVGSSLAIIFARMGIKNLIFVDYKRSEESHIIKHFYCNKCNINEFKNEALKSYLLEINNSLNIQTFNKKLVPNSNLYEYIPEDTDIVINTADEPYIGHTSIKIGRYCWDKNIAFYVGGGFDAHSMSTGEIIIPGVTPCIDCYCNSFQVALKNYKPTYITKTIDDTQNNIIIGGPGSISACSLFSASFAAIRIIYYLLGINNDDCNMTNRGEYILNKGIINWVKLGSYRKPTCKVCNKNQ